MTRSARFAWGTMIVLVVALAGVGAWAVGYARDVRDTSEVAEMTRQMKTVCVGRFLVDVPAHATIGSTHEMIGGFAVDTVEQSESAFRERLAAREARIQAEKGATRLREAGGMVEARDLRMPHRTGRVLGYGRAHSYGMDGDRRIDEEWVTVEAHAHLQGFSVVLPMEYASQSDADAAEALIARVRRRDPDGTPSMPGFCIRKAVFAEPLPPHRTEHVVTHVGLPGHPDMGLALASTPSRSAERGLPDPVADMDAQASVDEMLRVTKRRSGKRRIHDIDGEEVLERVRELNATTGYDFVWEAPGVEDDTLHPSLSLTMETGTNPRAGGEPVESSLHDVAALALWDRISSSIRPQAGARPDVCTSEPTAAARDSGPARR